MACGVKITISSAALLHHRVCSIIIYCREKRGTQKKQGKERSGTEKEKNKGNGGRRGDGGGELLNDAGNKRDLKELETTE